MLEKTKVLTAISLFAGGGGLSLGLKNAGFRSVLATDIEKSSATTFAHNLPDVPFIEADIRRLSKSDFLKIVGSAPVDLIAGGPPCQGFSTLGDQNPADPRNGLFWCFLRVVGWISPSCVLLENVNYLRTQYGGRYEQEITAALERLGYRVSVATLNAADFGVPQIRKRVFFFGTKLANDFTWPKATFGTSSNPHAAVWPAIHDLCKPEALDVLNNVHLNHSERVVARYKLIPEGGRMPPPSELPAEIRRKNFGNTYKRLHRERPSLTLVPGNNAFPVHPTEHRSLSPREGARLQTFPDAFVFFGTRAEQCKLVGNAVPVLLAEKIGRMIHSHVTNSILLDDKSATAFNIPQFPLPLSDRPRLRPRPAGVTGVSFFTGIGGLALGFMNAGINVLASYDLKNSVAKNLKLNFPDLNHKHSDIAKLNLRQLRQDIGMRTVDVVFGGPPCQGFSIFGRRRFINTRKHKPDQDERNELSIKFVELAIGLKPRAIFMENVKGFVSTSRGKSTYLAAIESRLRKAGYDLQHKVINCAAYGVPQFRERFVLVAWKRKDHFLWPEGKHVGESKPWRRPHQTVGDVISDLMHPSTHSQDFSHAPMNHKPLVVERYKLIPEGQRLPDVLPADLQKGYRSQSVKNFSHVYKRLSMSAPATTMVPGHNAFPVHPILHRTLTVREAARIQTFPDWMRFLGTRQQQCTLVGNAVPPLLAEVFATAIVKMMKGAFKSEGYKRDIYDLATSK